MTPPAIILSQINAERLQFGVEFPAKMDNLNGTFKLIREYFLTFSWVLKSLTCFLNLAIKKIINAK